MIKIPVDLYVFFSWDDTCGLESLHESLKLDWRVTRTTISPRNGTSFKSSLMPSGLISKKGFEVHSWLLGCNGASKNEMRMVHGTLQWQIVFCSACSALNVFCPVCPHSGSSPDPIGLERLQYAAMLPKFESKSEKSYLDILDLATPSGFAADHWHLGWHFGSSKNSTPKSQRFSSFRH